MGVEREIIERCKARVAGLSINSPAFYEMLCALAAYESDSCGDCHGFQCDACFKGQVVAYASINKPFYEWLSKNPSVMGVRCVLKSLSESGV